MNSSHVHTKVASRSRDALLSCGDIQQTYELAFEGDLADVDDCRRSICRSCRDDATEGGDLLFVPSTTYPCVLAKPLTLSRFALGTYGSPGDQRPSYTSVVRMGSLRQSLLQRAFSGVAQNSAQLLTI